MKAFVNGTFITCENDNRICSVMVVDKGKIAYIGDSLPEQYQSAKKVDVNGKCILPVFADTHIHFESFALFNGTLDVREAKDFNEMGKMFREYEKKNPNVKFIAAFGCCAHTVTEGRLPEREDIDKMTKLPTLIVKYDGHAGVANSALCNQFPDKVKEDEGYNEKSGWLYQNAFYLGVNYISEKVPPAKIIKNLIAASDMMAKRGIGLIHNVEGVGYKNDVDVTTIKYVSKALPQTFRIFFQTMDVAKVQKFKFPRIGGCFRLALDGCFGSEDAALLQPYCNNSDNKGFLTHTQEEVNKFCLEAHKAGLQISMHAIGDAAVEQALNAYEAAQQAFPRKDCRHIIIHANLMNEEMQERAKKLGILIATQPAFLYWRHEPQEYLDQLLGIERSYAVMPLKSWIDKGIIVSSGSDSPCTIPDPIKSIYYSCNHPNPDESIDVLDAIRMHTSWAAYTSFDEDTLGTLTEGKKADFIVLNKNPLAIPKEDLLNMKVERTYFEGKEYIKPIPNVFLLVCKILLSLNKKC